MHANPRRLLLGLVFFSVCLEVRAEPPLLPNVVYLNAGAIDTSAAPAQARRMSVPSPGKQLRLIQFAGAIQPAWVEELGQSGLQIVDYIPENTYLVYGDGAAVQRMQLRAAGRSHVRWEGQYRGVDKIHPLARAEAATKNELRSLEPDLFAIQLVFDPATNKETLSRIEAAGGGAYPAAAAGRALLQCDGSSAGGQHRRIGRAAGRHFHLALCHAEEARRETGHDRRRAALGRTCLPVRVTCNGWPAKASRRSNSMPLV